MTVADYLRSDGQLIGLSNVALGLMSLALIFAGLRARDRLALRLVWILAAYLVAVVVLAAGSSPAIAAFYALLAGAAAIGLLPLKRGPRVESTGTPTHPS